MKKFAIFFVLCVIGVQCNAVPYIFNGQRSSDVPYNAYILYLNNQNAGFFGGGSLISDRHVITAAQNIIGFVRWDVGLGSAIFGNLRTQTSTQAIPHPEYMPNTRNNDIAIIILPNPVTFSVFVAPVALPQLESELPLENEEGLYVGFGFTSPAGAARSDFLQRGFKRVIATTRCQQVYQITPPNHFCAVDENENSNICNGDIGAGFTTSVRRQEVLVGVASLITRSCEAVDPSGYVRISVYRQWIRDQTGL